MNLPLPLNMRTQKGGCILRHSTEIRAPMTLWERFLSIFSKRAAENHMMARYGYDGASPQRRHEGWVSVGGNAEQINSASREIIRRKVRDLERNSDIANSVIGAYTRNVVGSGFLPQADTGDEELNAQIEVLFDEWQKPANCDITGSQSFLEICNMLVRRMVVDGGMIFVKVRGGDGNIPFQLQAREVSDLDGDYWNSYASRGATIIGGVEVNAYGKPLAYHIKQLSPDGWDLGSTKRMPASDVIAVWQKTMPSQIREMPPMAVAVSRVADAEDFMNTVSIKEKILASLAVFIKRQEPLTPTMGRAPTAQKETDRYGRMRVSPGMVQELLPGDDVQAVIPNGQATNTREMASIYNRLLSAGQGLSYEAVSRDMSQVNYSSARQGLLEDQKTYQRMQRFLIDHFLDVLYEEIVVAGVTSGKLAIPDFWANKAQYLKHTWTLPGWSWIDPVKEVNANKIAMESGQTTLASVCASRGEDWQDVLRQRAKEMALQQELYAEYGVIPEKGDETDEETTVLDEANSEEQE
nr:MAG TPA: portal protein [Caudoviricetes sp.]